MIDPTVEPGSHEDYERTCQVAGWALAWYFGRIDSTELERKLGGHAGHLRKRLRYAIGPGAPQERAAESK